MAAQRNQKASNPNLSMTYSPSNDRALRAIADELRRIGDVLSAPSASPATHATSNAPGAASPNAPNAAADEAVVPVSPAEEALFQSLREWRAGEARKLGMPPYIVATDKALRALAAKRPASVEDLRGIPGFGPAKAAKYGPNVVELVAGA